ncbi:MAG: DUF4350 domain-containing protein [Gammaproteobacteria bacterium]
MKRDYMLLALVVVVIAGIAVWFHSNFELREERKHVGFQGEARTNDLLAAEKFLERTDTPVKSVDSLLALQKLPPPTDTIILPTARRTVGPERSAQLLDWVRKGGHLIVVTWTITPQPEEREPQKDKAKRADKEHKTDKDDSNKKDSPRPTPVAATRKDPLLDPLGVHQYFNSGDIDRNDYIPANVVIAHIPDFLEVAFRPRYRLEDSSGKAVASVSDDYGIHLLHYRIGQGGLTVLSDYNFMQNGDIGKYDHAAFLWQLAHWNGRQGRVWLVHNDDMPPLYELLAAEAWPVLVALGVLLLAWLWAASRRFGPLQPNPEPVRRSLREHIRASGRFLWKQGYSQRLLDHVRRALLERLDALHPGTSRLAPEALSERLAELTDIPAKDIALALSEDMEHNEHEFTRRIRILENLRKAL